MPDLATTNPMNPEPPSPAWGWKKLHRCCCCRPDPDPRLDLGPEPLIREPEIVREYPLENTRGIDSGLEGTTDLTFDSAF